MTDDAAFPRELAAIGDACAATLARLYDVVAAQQRDVLALVAGGGALRSAARPSATELRAQITPAAAADGAASPASPPDTVTGESPASPEVAPAADDPAPADPAPLATAAALLALELDAAKGIYRVGPSIALAALQSTAVHAIGLAMYNVVAQQQNLATLAQAVLTVEASRRLVGQAAPPADAPAVLGDAAPHAAAR